MEQSRVRAHCGLLVELKRQECRIKLPGLLLCECAFCGECVLCSHVYTLEQLGVISGFYFTKTKQTNHQQWSREGEWMCVTDLNSTQFSKSIYSSDYTISAGCL